MPAYDRDDDNDNDNTDTPLIGHFDGLVEPWNPGGHACVGWCFFPKEHGSEVSGGYYLGHGYDWHDPAAKIMFKEDIQTTNNLAEYLAAIECLRKIYRHPWRGPVLLRGDSQLVIHQYNNKWQCNSPHLQRALSYLRVAAGYFERVEMEWVPREQNQKADGEARKIYRGITGREPPDRRKKKQTGEYR